MASNGDELINPATGLRTVFRQTAEGTHGELLQVDWIAAAPWTTGPDHIHPLQDERAVQRVLLAVVAAVGRLLGYRPQYPYSSRIQPMDEAVGSNT